MYTFIPFLWRLAPRLCRAIPLFSREPRNTCGWSKLILVSTGVKVLSLNRRLEPVVRKLDNAILWINLYPKDNWLVSRIRIHWMVIYPVDSVIQRSQNWGMTFRREGSFSLANESVDVVNWFAFHQAQCFSRHYGNTTPQLNTFSCNGVVSIVSDSQMCDNGSWLKGERRTGDGSELPVPAMPRKHVREKMLTELFSSSQRSPDQ